MLFALCASMSAERIDRGVTARPRLVKARYLEGARAIAPIGVAAFAFALSFGVLARTAGMGWAAPIVMSATTFAGSAQFAVASMLEGRRRRGGGDRRRGDAERALRPDRDLGRARAFEGSVAKRLSRRSSIVDESWAVALKRRGGFDVRVLLGAGALLYLTWNVGTAVGLLLGNAIGDAEPPRTRRRVPRALPRAARPAADGPARARPRRCSAAAIALALIPFTPAGVPIVAGACRAASSAGVQASERGLAVRARRRGGDDRLQGDRPGAARPARAARVARRPGRPCSRPAVLAALVVTQAVAGHREIVARRPARRPRRRRRRDRAARAAAGRDRRRRDHGGGDPAVLAPRRAANRRCVGTDACARAT